MAASWSGYPHPTHDPYFIEESERDLRDHSILDDLDAPLRVPFVEWPADPSSRTGLAGKPSHACKRALPGDLDCVTSPHKGRAGDAPEPGAWANREDDERNQS